jgi:hypothetical protein
LRHYGRRVKWQRLIFEVSGAGGLEQIPGRDYVSEAKVFALLEPLALCAGPQLKISRHPLNASCSWADNTTNAAHFSQAGALVEARRKHKIATSDLECEFVRCWWDGLSIHPTDKRSIGRVVKTKEAGIFSA